MRVCLLIAKNEDKPDDVHVFDVEPGEAVLICVNGAQPLVEITWDQLNAARAE